MNRVVFVLIFFPSIQLAAQSREITYFDKTQNAVVKENCHYYSVSKKSYNDIDSILSFYCETNRPRSIRHVNSDGIPKGRYRMFHENGSLKTKGMCEAFTFFDSLYEWYPDGSLHYVEYRGTRSSPDRKLVLYRSSSGKFLVKNGEGFCDRCRFDGYSEVEYSESGIVRSGVKDSIWTTYNVDGSKAHEDRYEMGKFISGTFFSPFGENVSYTLIEEMAVPQNGMPAFYKFISKNIIYPKTAKRQKIQGRVYVEFIVENDGSIKEVKCIKGIGGGCDEEAERVIATASKWKPGRQRGRFVRQKMVLPINFLL
jgi:TonB family protein